MRKLKINELHRLAVEEYRESIKSSLVVILDNIRSLHNVGSVFRSSDAFRVAHICLCGITATPPQAEIHKTALGAEDTVNWTYYKNTLDAVHHWKEQGYKVFAIEQVENSISLDQFEVEKGDKIAIVMGNEVKGVQQEVVDNCEQSIEIPQFGTKHSLNVSVTTGIVIWDIFNKLKAING
ncbi:MAG: RNA methyltransferase [Bacteroidaceae bacterium]